MFKLGSIRKIEVTNFVTYNHVELFPGPNLNMLIGPNGTGKSTIVAAIILGLGGNPKTVGRGHKVSEYVKHNCEKATIHIHLQEERENEFVKITRIITDQDKSSWLLNNKKVLSKDILNCVKRYQIQVDNLCQFLPQDRVQDFAKLNQQQLLKETQIALCRLDLVEKHEALIECRTNQKNVEHEMEKSREKLEENRNANLRLEGKIENFSRKKVFLTRIADLDRKCAWVEYDQAFEAMQEVKDDLKKATDIFEKHRNEVKPMEDGIRKAKRTISELQQNNANVTKSMRDNETKSKSYLEKIEHSEDKIKEIQEEMIGNIAVLDQKKQEIESTAQKVAEMKRAQLELLNTCGNDEEIQSKSLNLTNEVQRFRRHISALENQKDDLIELRHQKHNELRARQHESERLENIKQQRLNYLERVAKDAYQGVLWLRNNKHLFQSEVYEPIMLEINVLDPKMALYVENVIPMKDRIAFTCTNKDDMNNLIKHLRTEKQLQVNVVYSSSDTHTQYRSNIPIENLRKYGLYTYVNSLITAPIPIFNYLCKTYSLHNIPVGNVETNRYFEDLPQNISVFFSDSVRYSVSYSKYSSSKSIRQNEIHSDGGLSISLNVTDLENVKNQIEDLQKSMSNCDTQLKEFDSQIKVIRDKMTEMEGELRNIRNVKQQAQTIGNRIIAMETSLAERRRNLSNGEDFRQEANTKIKRLVRGIRQIALDLKAIYKAFTVLKSKSVLNSLKIEKAREAAAFLENQNEEKRRLLQESEIVVNNVKESYTKAKNEAKSILQKAKNLSNNFTPDDGGFDQFRETYESLDNDVERLQEEKSQIMAQIDCLNTADDEEMIEYERRLQTIEGFQTVIDQSQRDLSKLTARLERLQSEWLTPLRQLVDEINSKFSRAFERMGCAGEVSINASDDIGDFAKYGLCIKVTYRDGEPLQELNSCVQSGGEKAVATAVFMLSLQELTPVPFRCVDEINQGMDSDNERRIFRLLMELTGQVGSAQYFLVTPKLIPDLVYSAHTMVHIVNNGPFIKADCKWGRSRMCNPQMVTIN